MNKQSSIEKLKALDRMFEESPTGAIKDAIEALQKQIPLRPINQENREADHVRIGQCPSCEKWWITKSHNYCPGCGQAIDWSVKDE